MKKYKITFVNPAHPDIIVVGSTTYTNPQPMLDAQSGLRYWSIDDSRFPVEHVLCITEVKE